MKRFCLPYTKDMAILAEAEFKSWPVTGYTGYADIRRHVQSCHRCGLGNDVPIPRAEMKPTVVKVDGPFNRWQIDVVGPIGRW